MDTSGYARWFRGSTPYISMHRNRTFVVALDGAAFAHSNFVNVVHDLALVHVLGARLVLVHGAREQLDAALPNARFHAGRRITTPDDMPTLLGVVGQLRSQLEALLSTGLPTSPLRETDIAVVSGNFVTARPVGVLDGVDHELTGRTRKVHGRRIRAALDAGAMVLLSPLGYSSSGQVFNLAADELAADVALSLGADKLLTFTQTGALTDASGERLSVLTPSELTDWMAANDGAEDAHLKAALRACRGGVRSCQLVSYERDGALLSELFTAAGDGTQITESHHELVRSASSDDVASIVEMIRPLEELGVLVRRSRDRLEQEIEQFLVADLDRNVVGCCAVYPFGDAAELACVAVHPAYRDAEHPSIGHALLAAAEARARSVGAKRLFALTTQTRDWFLDHGFEDANPGDLPAPKQALYNYQRNARVMMKRLD